MPRSTFALFLSVMTGTVALQANAQTRGANSQSIIATDRPQITSSSVVVPYGSLQFENGVQETSNGGQRGYDLPETSVRFGIASKTELRLAAPNYFFNDATATGLSDLSLGFKQQLGPTRGGFDVSLIPSVSLPTGANLISSHGYDPTLQLPWSHSLTKNWTAAGMFSLMWPTEATRRNLMGQSSLYFDRQIRQPWDAYVEYSGTFPQRGGPQHTIGFGTAYKPSPHQQLDFHCSFGLSAATPITRSVLAILSASRFDLDDGAEKSQGAAATRASSCLSGCGRFDLEVPGNVDHHDALIPAYKQKQFQQLSPLVVKRSLPPVVDD
jgi:Putative MetA-pathway of phenol degradation